MQKWIILAVIAVLGAGSVSLLTYNQTAVNTPIVVSKDGITAQVQSCTKTSDNQFIITVLLTADPTKLLYFKDIWGGKVALTGYGITTAFQGFQNLRDRWTATAPLTVPLIELPNYNCQIGGWTPVLNTG